MTIRTLVLRLLGAALLISVGQCDNVVGRFILPSWMWFLFTISGVALAGLVIYNFIKAKREEE